MHFLPALAKKTIELYVIEGTRYSLNHEEIPDEFRRQAGVFVCLKTKGILRGCIGTFQPQQQTIAHETICNAINAASCDMRFTCVRQEELPDIEYTVDILTTPEKVAAISELDPKRYGIIVQAGNKRGLLLPDIEGVDTVDYQVNIAMQKAGIKPGSFVELSRFEVQRYQ
ncbi:MAG: AmmeMemoRadiSam system protein A [Nitrospirota bacterium]